MKLDMNSTLRMKSGHEIPVLGYGMCTMYLTLNDSFSGSQWPSKVLAIRSVLIANGSQVYIKRE